MGKADAPHVPSPVCESFSEKKFYFDLNNRRGAKQTLIGPTEEMLIRFDPVTKHERPQVLDKRSGMYDTRAIIRQAKQSKREEGV